MLHLTNRSPDKSACSTDQRHKLSFQARLCLFISTGREGRSKVVFVFWPCRVETFSLWTDVRCKEARIRRTPAQTQLSGYVCQLLIITFSSSSTFLLPWLCGKTGEWRADSIRTEKHSHPLWINTALWGGCGYLGDGLCISALTQFQEATCYRIIAFHLLCPVGRGLYPQPSTQKPVLH